MQTHTIFSLVVIVRNFGVDTTPGGNHGFTYTICMKIRVMLARKFNNRVFQQISFPDASKS